MSLRERQIEAASRFPRKFKWKYGVAMTANAFVAGAKKILNLITSSQSLWAAQPPSGICNSYAKHATERKAQKNPGTINLVALCVDFGATRRKSLVL
jgi:hypothetical protein